MKRPSLIVVNNFKEKIHKPIKNQPKKTFWTKLDEIINLILF